MPGQPYASDEDIAIETNDYRVLSDATALAAYGKDGSIDPIDPWVLHSDLTDFEANDVQPGTIIYLMEDLNFGADPGTAYVVQGIDGPHNLRLRNRGMVAGRGDPPGNPGATIAGITFEARTLAPMILKAANEIDEQFDISGILARNPGMVFSPDDMLVLNRMNVYKLLDSRYLSVSKGTEVPGAKENFRDKSDEYKRRYDELAGKLTLRFTTSPEAVTTRRARWSRIIR